MSRTRRVSRKRTRRVSRRRTRRVSRKRTKRVSRKRTRRTKRVSRKRNRMKGGSWGNFFGFGQEDSNEEEEKYAQYESAMLAAPDKHVVTPEQLRLEKEVEAAAPSDDDEGHLQQQRRRQQDRNSAADEAQRFRDLNLTPYGPPASAPTRVRRQDGWTRVLNYGKPYYFNPKSSEHSSNVPRGARGEIQTFQTRDDALRHMFEEDKGATGDERDSLHQTALMGHIERNARPTRGRSRSRSARRRADADRAATVHQRGW